MSDEPTINGREILNLAIPGVRIDSVKREGRRLHIAVETELPLAAAEEVLLRALQPFVPEGCWIEEVGER